jgi:hypothetical protein
MCSIRLGQTNVARRVPSVSGPSTESDFTSFACGTLTACALASCTCGGMGRAGNRCSGLSPLFSTFCREGTGQAASIRPGSGHNPGEHPQCIPVRTARRHVLLVPFACVCYWPAHQSEKSSNRSLVWPAAVPTSCDCWRGSGDLNGLPGHHNPASSCHLCLACMRLCRRRPPTAR